jgi:Flp pilus assembly protein TadG
MVVHALLLGVLMTMTALAVDVGSFYNRASELQKAADAGALAAVVFMPDNLTGATTAAREAAARNGFAHGVNGVTVTVEPVTGKSTQIKVKITDPNVRTFFGSLVTAKIAMSRDATAAYVLAVPLGSPQNTFGNQQLGDAAPNFWGAINGPYTAKEQGDPFATRCTRSNSNSSCQTANPDYRPEGYLLAVEVPAGAAGRELTVELFDAPFNNRGSAAIETGELDWFSTGMPLSYELFEADSTPVDHSDNPSLNGRCTTGPGRLQYAAGSGGTRNTWSTLCTFTTMRSGVYPLRIRSAITGATNERGYASAHYAVRTTLAGAGPQPRVYGIGDMSIITQATGVAEFHLAEVAEVHAGKTLEIELFDPGDGSGSSNFTLQILAPGGAVATCRYTQPNGSWTNSGPCSMITRNPSAATANLYNGAWLAIRIQVPDGYTCTDCWWKVRYDFGANGTPTDRTTWRAAILGDPVHLVE